jgi:uncharacterized RDD family membrane protein YckC
MLVCPRCGFYNSEVVTRCDQCHAWLSAADRERSPARQQETEPELEAPAAVLRGDSPVVVCPGCGAAATSRFCPDCGRQLSGEPEYAGFWIRGGALLIDSIIVGVAGFILVAFLPAGYLSLLLLLVAPAIYEVSFETRTGATLGKKALGLRVVTPTLQPLSLGRSIARYFAHYLSSLFFIGFIIAAFNREKRALHDFIAGTIVIKER